MGYIWKLIIKIAQDMGPGKAVIGELCLRRGDRCKLVTLTLTMLLTGIVAWEKR